MNKSYIYAETAFHHEGDMQYIKGLIDAASAIELDGIKFQVLTKTSDFISTQHTAFDTLSNYCFSYEEWDEIFEYTTSKNLDIIMMPLNLGSFDLLHNHTIAFLDIHSVSFYDQFLLEKVKVSKIPIILGVGGRTLEEIDAKMSYFEGKIAVLMAGFQAFPSDLKEVKIGKIKHLVSMYPNIAIGYADHSGHDNPFAISSNEYARLLGATYFEKHMTLHQGVERVDFNSAIDAEQLKKMKSKIRFIEEHVLTNREDSFEFHASETTYRNRQLICVSNSDLAQGSVLREEDVSLKMIDSDREHFFRREDIVGKKLLKAVSFDNPIEPQHFANE
jgi:N,N'-diacetyllegionaminate synthase